MRYTIGIDLGTTNCCIAFVDLEDPKLAIQLFRIPQLNALGYVELMAALPSFCYLAAPHEWPKGTLKLPWKQETDFILGKLAKEHGSKVPMRLVQSAKSWLCHSAANRRDKILPFDAADDTQRISPVEASARYLEHIREAWNHTIAQGNQTLEFEQQHIILTVPASFDEVARVLTVEAAKLAGFTQTTLLEEPQAAYYSWLSQHENQWEKHVTPGDVILVCDVGGGTTDFSLIEVSGQDGKLAFQRMAVGDHLLLGGDNMDASIAYYLESKLHQQLTSFQWLQLKHQARLAKEALLGDKREETYPILLQGSGASVVKGSLSLDISHDEILQLLLEGFFGQYDWGQALQLRKTSGFRTMGLPYVEEPSITKHLAAFLNKNPRPDYVLFNGGAMKPKAFQEAIIKALMLWFPEKFPKILPTVSLDTAVARGAAYYGKAKQGYGVRIGGGTPRSYYLGIELIEDGQTTTKALTLLPRGSEEGSSYEPEHIFWLKPNTPVSFQLMTSHTRLYDRPGELIAINDEEMHSLPPIHTILRYGKRINVNDAQEKIPVRLHVELTAIGTLELSLKSEKTAHQWMLEFQLRSAAGQEQILAALNQPRKDETFDKHDLKEALLLIQNTFSGDRLIKPGKLMEHLEKQLDKTRLDWSSSILRGLWDALLREAPHRKNSIEQGTRWWNLAGFLLRPGCGYPLDDFRIKEIWKVILEDLKNTKDIDIQLQQWICFRRIAAGLNKGQQMQIFSEKFSDFLNKKSDRIEAKSNPYHYSEKARVLGALELLNLSLKEKLGRAFVQKIISGNAVSADYWALARIGARSLMYGSAANVIPRDICSQWIETLLQRRLNDKEQLAFVLGLLAKKTDHRELNLSHNIVNLVMQYFAGTEQENRLYALLSQGTVLTEVEQEQIFGDRLPVGLTLEIINT